MDMSIGEFIRALKARNESCNSPNTRWASEFRQAGYFSANLTENGRGIHHWQAVHQWCKTEVGEDHYSWTGSQFWFEKQEHAVMFLLKWG